MKKNNRLLVLLLFFMIRAGSLSLHAQQVYKPTSPAAYIDSMIATAVEIGKRDTANALIIFHQAQIKSKALKDDLRAGRIFFEMGNMFFNHKNHNRSFGAYFNARDKFVACNSPVDKARSLFGLGREQYFRGNYKVAAGHLNFAMREARAMKLPALESDALEYLGILYHVMPGTGLQSIDHLKKSFFIKRILKDQKGMLRMIEKIGSVYYQQNEYDSALHYQEQAIKLATSLGLKHDIEISRLEKTATLIRMHRFQPALDQLNQLAVKGDTTDLNIRIRFFLQLANLMIAKNNLELAAQYFEQALSSASTIGVPEMFGMVYQQMAESYYHKGMFKEAYVFAKRYNEQMKSYYAENTGTLNELEYIFNSTLTRDELHYLNAENKLQEIRLTNGRNWRIALTIALGVFLLFSGLIAFLYRKQKLKNAIIDKQREDLKTLIREMHHRVKNNLQIISSLLDLQATLINDPQAAIALKEGRNRVHSMALIHQNLYAGRNIKGIAIKEYIENLSHNLLDSYSVKPGTVIIDTDIDEMELDIDKITPLGLILNELISNSLKHAFDNKSGGKIQVILKKKHENIFLKVKDNGGGFLPGDLTENQGSFGLRMIKKFARKLNAELIITNDMGACITMTIPGTKMTS